MYKLTIYGGNDKYGNPEGIQRLDLFRGELYTIVGNTGSGKSRLIKDIEQLANHDTITQRSVFIDDTNFSWEERQQRSLHFVAHLGQYALHVGYNRKGFFEFTRTLQSKANQFR